MTIILCAVPDCALPNRHADTCPQDDCPGCLPARAADGKWICDHHTRSLGYNAARAARLYASLGKQLMPGHRPGEYTSGGGHGAPVPDEHVMALRAAIQHLLVTTARLIIDRRGIHGPVRWTIRRLPEGVHGPAQRVPVATGNREALAILIAKHRDWLAAQPEAGDLAARFDELGRVGGEAWRAAHPHAADRLYVGDCPLAVTEDDGSEGVCGSRLYQVPDEPLITCSGCGVAETIEQWERWIFPEGEAPEVDAYAAARSLSRWWARPVDPALVRKWAERARAAGRELAVTEPDPTDPAGTRRRPVRVATRVVYQLEALREEATRRWGDPIWRYRRLT